MDKYADVLSMFVCCLCRLYLAEYPQDSALSLNDTTRQLVELLMNAAYSKSAADEEERKERQNEQKANNNNNNNNNNNDNDNNNNKKKKKKKKSSKNKGVIYNDADDDALSVDLRTALHQLVFHELGSHQPLVDNIDKSDVHRFVAMLLVKSDTQTQEIQYVTPILSALIYCCRAAVLYQFQAMTNAEQR